MARMLLKHKFTILSLFLFILLVEGESYKFSRQLSPKSYESKELKQTQLFLFTHERVGGDHPTDMEVAKGAMTDTYSSKFGLTIVTDKQLREDAEPTSKILGRVQGIGSYVGLEKPTLMMVYNYMFVVGKFNESTLSVLGSNPILLGLNEFTIVGGTGLFLDARGHVMTVTYSENVTSGEVIYLHGVDIYHN